ncbi:tyrosine-type recombinase/integrase [Corallococcus sp. AS-1-12]|uniref:tyrosine-type recombinase/integrase n=1 Tax=Corallococcus sp. AS-1-12 TaxID=2874598 RepID=UPI001CBCCA3A|nr:tyrosine-type recombinase/integrase [Corallococcus sp. AS-1-12]MBZ4329707.1 tyrosine-type recombinase/integrase [Corallococcus sp. AS-1-12]
MKAFLSCFAPHLSEYVALRRRLGFQFKTQAELLIQFDRFTYARRHEGAMTAELIVAFATSGNVSEVHQSRRYQVVCNFTEYLANFEPKTPLMDPRFIRWPRQRPVPHIYTDDEVLRLLKEAKKISSRHPVRGATVHAMVGLGAATGMRISEVLRLDRHQVDLRTGVLTIVRTKFNKDRLVPVHATTLEVLRRYAELRDAHFGEVAEPAFFLNLRGRRYSRHTAQLDFWRLGRAAGLREAAGDGPRYHDLRHTFAVRRLAGWYREGLDLMAMLPVLATYMGHAHYSDTAYYLTATAELLGLAADRFASFVGDAKEVTL